MLENSLNTNTNCRFCETNFNVKFGKFEKQGWISIENLFKPSNIKDCTGTIFVEILKVQGSKFNKVHSYLYLKGFATPAPVKSVKPWKPLDAFVQDSLSGECKTPEKRPQTKWFLDTPQGTSPRQKTACVTLPASKRSLP